MWHYGVSLKFLQVGHGLFKMILWLVFRWVKFTLKPPCSIGTLPIGIFCQIWTQDSLTHLLWHLMVTFDICQLLGTLGPFEYLCQNWVPSENQSGQMTRLHDGTILGGGCNTLKGVPGAVGKKIAFLSTFLMPWRVLIIYWFDQESVHRCSLGCSTYLVVDFWICDQLAICWAIKWQFLRCQKVADFFDLPNFGILSHKLA